MAARTPTATHFGCTRPDDCVEQRAGRYLTAIHWLGDESDVRVRTGAVSDRVGVTPATVTEAFERLAADALVDYEKGAGVVLTDRGAQIARALARRQCVVRAFFATELGVEYGPGDGYRFGYALSEDGVEALRRLVDFPAEQCWQGPGEYADDCPCETMAP
jgi:DtxR family Mn-dependent transcriptional regulator